MDNQILTNDQKIRIMEIANSINGSLESFDDRYKQMVDLITGYVPKPEND